ncbi:MAG: phosphoribosylaminoimidazolesuccinocarboxamide synthase, partial [Dehalococcoidales bacterium]|nr:phosphoribosylaminoimidazolesuccinocarboxamide synthase [Dehalococcoidales bacterium]
GMILNQLSAFWFEKTNSMISNHLIEIVNDVHCLDKYLPAENRFTYPPYLAGRSMIVKTAKTLPVECVVRGYLSGSAWSEYQNNGTVAGISLPKGLQESEELPQPLFTPTTKAETGHDLPLSINDMEILIGKALTREITEISLAIYSHSREYAKTKNIIIADTKMEFGLDNNKLILIDELLTPDSSRFWNAEQYKVGQSQPSYDKQLVRDWLVKAGWDKTPPPPPLSPEVIKATSNIYREAYEKLTSRKLK